MSLWRYIQSLFSKKSGQDPQKIEQRYDNVQIRNVVDGITIKGHEAVKTYLDEEKKLYQAHGSVITFQVYRINLQADTIEKLQGEKLAEIKVAGGFISGDDKVAAVKEKLRSLMLEKAGMKDAEEPKYDLTIKDTDYITFYFSGRPMQDNTLFYADNFIMLPAWVQVLIHDCEFDEIVQLIAKLSKK